jgi:phosphatidyl-myo-inositol dimannoside synthase
MQRHLSHLLKWLAEAGATITLLTTEHGCTPASTGCSCTVVPGTRPGRYSRAWWNGTRALSQRSIECWDVIVSEDGGGWGLIDGLRSHDRKPAVVMFRHGTTLLNASDNLRSLRPRTMLSAAQSVWDYWRFPRRLSKCVEIMVAPSERIAASVRREGAGPGTEVRVVLPGVDLREYSPTRDPELARLRLGLAPNVFTMLWAGRDVPQKRLGLALDVFERLRSAGIPVQFVIAASGARLRTRAAVRRLRGAWGPSVAIFEDVPPDQMPSMCAAADLAMFTSHMPEGVPFVILEALACGLPVIAARTRAIKSLPPFLDEPTWLLDDRSPLAWVDRIASLTVPQELARARRSARAIAEKYFDARVAARLSVQAVLDGMARRPKTYSV